MRRPPIVSAAGPALLLLLAATGAALGQDGATLRVAQDGSGEFDTIAAAVEAAASGDTILIAPGRYVESLWVDKPLTLAGDGPRESVWIGADRGGSPLRAIEFEPNRPVTLFVDGADVTIEHLTLHGVDLTEEGPVEPREHVISLALIGGTSTVQDIVTTGFTAVRDRADVSFTDSDLAGIGAAGPMEVMVRDNRFDDRLLIVEGASATIEGNVFEDYPLVIAAGGEATVTGNTFHPRPAEDGIVVEAGSKATVTGNVIEGGGLGMLIRYAHGTVVEGNDVSGMATGILAKESRAIVRGNTISDVDQHGMVIVGGGVLVEDNAVEGGRIGVWVRDTEDPQLPAVDAPSVVNGNTITGASHYGVVVEDSAPVVSDNTICAGSEPLRIVGRSNPQLGSNEICEVADA